MDFNGHKQMVPMKGRRKPQIIVYVRQDRENNLLYLKLYFTRNNNLASSACGTIEKKNPQYYY